MSGSRNGAAEATVAVIYGRVSSALQADEGVSLDVQFAASQRFVAARRWHMDQVFIDVMSGKRDDRPEYGAVLDRVRGLRAEGRNVVLVVPALDRLGRRAAERMRLHAELKALGVSTFSVRDGARVTDRQAKRAADDDQKEVERVARRTREAWAELNAAGWFKCSSAVPWGYRSRPATAEERRPIRFGGLGAPATVLEVDPVIAPLVREAFERVVRGDSTVSVWEWLAGQPESVRGVRWSDDPTRTRNGEPRAPRATVRKMALRSVQTILRNPTYAGLVEYNANPTEKREDREQHPVWRRVPGKHEPIIGLTLWDAVQQRLDAHTVAPRRDPERYLLTGLLACSDPECGGRMNGATVRVGRSHHKTELRRYRCSNSTRVNRKGCTATADAPQIDRLVLDKVVDLVERAASDPDVQKALRRAYARLSAETAGPDTRVVKRLEKQAEEARTVIMGLEKRVILGKITEAMRDEMAAEAEAELRAATDQLQKMQAGATPTLPPIDTVLAELGGWAEVLRQADHSLDQRDKLALFVERVTPRRLSRGTYAVDIRWTSLGETLRMAAE